MVGRIPRSALVLGLVACGTRKETPPEPAPTATASATASAARPTASAPASPDASHLSSHGCDFDVSLRPVKRAIMVGEPTYVEWVVASLCDTDLVVMDGGDYRNSIGRNNSFRFEIATERGVEVPIRKAGFEFGGMIGGEPVVRSKPFVKRLFVPYWARLDTPGRYRIQVSKDMEIRAGDWKNDRDAPRVPARASTWIEVVPANRDAMGQLIEALAVRMAVGKYEDSQDAARELDAYEDERVTPHFAKVKDLDDATRRRVGVEVLAHFSSDASIDALERALPAPKPEARLAVVRAISDNGAPRALEVLWGLRTDKLESVRLVVVQGVHAKDPPDAKERLEEMARDPSAAVRVQAQKLLAERAAKK